MVSEVETYPRSRNLVRRDVEGWTAEPMGDSDEDQDPLDEVEDLARLNGKVRG